MEEKILEIIKRQTGIIAPDGAKEITAHVMEFIVWLQKGLHQFGRVENIDDLLYVNFKEGSKKQYTLEKVYEYWLKEIKK